MLTLQYQITKEANIIDFIKNEVYIFISIFNSKTDSIM